MKLLPLLGIILANCATVPVPQHYIFIECFDDFDSPLMVRGYAQTVTIDVVDQTAIIRWDDNDTSTITGIESCTFN